MREDMQEDMQELRDFRAGGRTLVAGLRAAGVVSAALVCAMAGVGSAWAGTLPPAHTQGAVTYVSGGIGDGQARSFEAAAATWPVMLEFAAQDPATHRNDFLANVQVQIVDARGQVVLDTRSDGPFVLARLQPGRYDVHARFDGQTLSRALQVAAQGTAREVFVWPPAAARATG